MLHHRAPRAGERFGVVERLQFNDRRLDLGERFVRPLLRISRHTDGELIHPRAQFDAAHSCRRRGCLRAAQGLQRPRRIARFIRSAAEPREQHRQVGIALGQELGCTSEERARRPGIGARVGPAAGLGQQACGARPERAHALIILSKLLPHPLAQPRLLGQVAVGLLEVVTQDLIRRLSAEPGREPSREALVQLGP